jgi:hypothetical protein
VSEEWDRSRDSERAASVADGAVAEAEAVGEDTATGTGCCASSSKVVMSFVTAGFGSAALASIRTDEIKSSGAS